MIHTMIILLLIALLLIALLVLALLPSTRKRRTKIKVEIDF